MIAFAGFLALLGAAVQAFLSVVASTVPSPLPAVRVIYAIPSDREFQSHYSLAVDDAIHHVQDWYAEQLDGWTFELEGPTPQVCELDDLSEYYEGEYGWARVIEGLQDCAPVAHWSERYTWVVYVDAAFDCEFGGELGAGGAGITIVHRGDLEGLSSPETYQMCGYPRRGVYGWIGGLAHELTHAFEVPHPPGCDEGLTTCDSDALMWQGYYFDYPETYLREDEKEILRTSPFFRPLSR